MTPLKQRALGLRDRYLADQRRPVQAYASETSAVAGGSLEFRVSAPGGGTCSVAVRRFGTPVTTRPVRFTAAGQEGPVRTRIPAPQRERSPETGSQQDDGSDAARFPPPSATAPMAATATGAHEPDEYVLTWCDWEPSLVLDIPDSWPTGLYAARFTVTVPRVSRHTLRSRSAYVPFVVRARWDQTTAPTLVVLPFSTYAAQNRWPIDGSTGRSLERGYTSDGRSTFLHRARAVSLDRPFTGNGLPGGFGADAAYVERLLADRRPADFATGVDLHSGLIVPSAYESLVFVGGDQYWSAEMRDSVARAVGSGTVLLHPAAWPPPTVRFGPSPDGRPDRVLSTTA